ncbi:UDP-glycosyltransferase 73C6-like isoform X2 [Salvia miltiorrhiza]|uniref:UDP-glycosyltransferase 73C6-like isoform X2 n=1 Tax=Salvia miltiorrhiza TaxID=226208 RepID=UPI0025AD78F7|nr:UDP-glycosyltransferase 73C6-like isoform X2 [Salvia miltiorrhiza]
MAQLHVLMIPLMSQSHIIPLSDFAKSLARRGALVSIVTTPLNAQRYKPILDTSAAQNLRIQMIPLHFPCREAGLPDGCENLDTLNSLHLARQFFHACKLLQAPLRALIHQLRPAPNCIISTSAISWTQDLADAFRIPRYVFETVSCFTLHCSKKISNVTDKDGVFLVPQIPHRIEFSRNQLPQISTQDSDPYVDRVPALGRGTLVNSFEELEPWYLAACREERGNVWAVGPVSLSNREVSERFKRGNEASIDPHYCLTWLESMKRHSVVYACFGSLCSLSLEQIIEIGLGLEESGFPFIWIIRKQEKNSGEVEEWLAAEGFVERVRGRGLVVRGWAPQVMILSHPSVGGFLTHCGWNSTLEGVSAGVPMITWPMFAEQFYNEKMVVDSCMEKQGVVGRERVRCAVEELMMDEREDRRERAEALARSARDAYEEGGSSSLNVTLFIQDVVRANAELMVNV